MSDLLKVTAPEGVTTATVDGKDFTIEEEGYFLMTMEEAFALSDHGFTVVVEGGDQEADHNHPSPILDPIAMRELNEKLAAEAHAAVEASHVAEAEARAWENAKAAADAEALHAEEHHKAVAAAEAAKQNGEAATVTEEEVIEATDGGKKDDTYLLGSSVQPAIFELEDGGIVQLGTVVAAAQTALGATAAEWNALSDADREALIQAQVDVLPVKKPAAAPEGTQGGDGAAPEAKA